MSVRQGNKTIAGHTGCHFDLFDPKWADHILNDPSWLRADTFSWQDGGVYKAAYNHLEADITGKSLQSETIAGITIQFYLADDKHKICPASEESNVMAIFSAIGIAWYYIIDTTNKRFKLPRDNSKKDRVLIKTITSGSNWARIYADGWVEQGGTLSSAANPTANFPITMVDTGYHILLTGLNEYAGERQIRLYVATKNTSSMVIRNTNSDSAAPGVPTYWEVKGYGNTTVLQNVSTEFAAEYKYLYFYVGNFIQSALENTAGLNAELFNDKADADLSNTPIATADYVVEWQNPTAGNNYTWYRKYKSGWVEQGQTTLTVPDSATTYSLPVEMSSGYYNLYFGFNQSSDGTSMPSTYNRTATSFSINSPAGNVAGWWQVSGIAAN